MTKGKRVEDANDEEEDLVRHPKRQRVPALARVVVEALQNYYLEILFSSLEPMFRRIVSEEVERALANLASGNNAPSHFPRQIEGPNGRNLQLRFHATLPTSMFTGQNIEAAGGAPVHIHLVDANTGTLVSSGPEASARLNVLVLHGDFKYEGTDDWTEDEFKEYVVKERAGRRPLLVGNLQVSLNKGVGTVGDLCFTDNSSFTRSGKFRVAVKVAEGCCNGTRIREAVTRDVVVKESRGKSYEKHHPPALEDEVWRLEGIAKGGAFDQKLKENDVHTVRDFLKSFFEDSKQLREKILGSSMSENNWKKLVDHAKTASLNGKHYVCYLDERKHVGAIFDEKCAFLGLIEGDQFISKDLLNDGPQQCLADALMNKAYGNWNCVTVYEGEDLIKGDWTATASSSSSFYLQSPPISTYSVMGNATEGDVASLWHDVNPAAVSSDPPADPNTHLLNPIAVPNNETEFAPPIERANDAGPSDPPADPNTHFLNPIAVPNNETPIERVNDAGYGTEHQQQQEHPNESSWGDYLSDEIRSMLEGDKMQSWLNDFCVGSSSVELDSCWWPDVNPKPDAFIDHDNERDRTPPRRAAVGWVKITTITAAMRWALFIRRRAADRRSAELVELQD